MDVVYFLLIFIPGAYLVLKPIIYGDKIWPLKGQVSEEILEKKNQLIEELKKLKNLYDRGEISEGEFEKLKKPVEEELLLLIKKYNLEI